SARVNKVRLDHLAQGADKYYIETGFTEGVNLGHSWSFSPKAFLGAAAGVSLGFNGGAKISSKLVLAATDDHIKTPADAMGQAALDDNTPLFKAVTGKKDVLVPMTIDDVLAMKPGEMFARRGQGQLGLNVGLGVPVLFPGVVASIGASA